MSDEGQLDPEIASLLRRQRPAVSVPDGVEQRLLSRLAISIPGLGEPNPPTGPGGDGASGPPAPAASGAVAKIGLLAATFVVGAIAGSVVTRVATPPAPPATVYVDRPVDLASAVPPSPTASVPTVSIDALPSSTVGASRAEGRRAPASGGETSEDPSIAERRLLDRARAALARGDHDAAMLVVGEHAQRYPRGRLSEEREALAVRVLADSSRLDEARSRAARFRTRWPQSILLPAVEAAVQSDR